MLQEKRPRKRKKPTLFFSKCGKRCCCNFKSCLQVLKTNKISFWELLPGFHPLLLVGCTFTNSADKYPKLMACFSTLWERNYMHPNQIVEYSWDLSSDHEKLNTVKVLLFQACPWRCHKFQDLSFQTPLPQFLCHSSKSLVSLAFLSNSCGFWPVEVQWDRSEDWRTKVNSKQLGLGHPKYNEVSRWIMSCHDMTWHVISCHIYAKTPLSQRLLGGITLQLDWSLRILLDLSHTVLGSVEGVSGRERPLVQLVRLCPRRLCHTKVDSFRTSWSPRRSHIGVEVLEGPRLLCFESISQWISVVWRPSADSSKERPLARFTIASPYKRLEMWVWSAMRNFFEPWPYY